MAEKNLPTPEELHNLLRYEPETGRLYWRERIGDDNTTKRWNGRYANTLAGSAGTGGYRNIGIHGRLRSCHRVAWAMYHMEWPDGQVDHVNGVTSDNRIANLRVVTHSENQRNCKRRSDNRSNCTGVNWSEGHGKWHARIGQDGKQTHLGLFSSKFDAVLARLLAAEALGYSVRHGRAP